MEWFWMLDLSPEEGGSSPDSSPESLPAIEPGEVTPQAAQEAAAEAAEALVAVKSLQVEALAGVLQVVQDLQTKLEAQVERVTAAADSIERFALQMEAAMQEAQEAKKEPEMPEMTGEKTGLARLVPKV